MAIECDQCGKMFEIIERDWQLKDEQGKTHVYCSMECTIDADPDTE